mmetsp:Transcript_51769/g.112534  ORF Transcript_51769/g.112534 Transcript_51769/m.112534 type:complete len:225 (+) Transcript_51769:3-677(+)
MRRRACAGGCCRSCCCRCCSCNGSSRVGGVAEEPTGDRSLGHNRADTWTSVTAEDVTGAVGQLTTQMTDLRLEILDLSGHCCALLFETSCFGMFVGCLVTQLRKFLHHGPLHFKRLSRASLETFATGCHFLLLRGQFLGKEQLFLAILLVLLKFLELILHLFQQSFLASLALLEQLLEALALLHVVPGPLHEARALRQLLFLQHKLCTKLVNQLLVEAVIRSSR